MISKKAQTSIRLQELLALGDKFSEELTLVTKTLSDIEEQITKINQYIKLKEEGHNPILSDFIDEDELKTYCENQTIVKPTKVVNVAIFDENTQFSDFLSWFYDELPYIGLNKLCLLSGDKTIPIGNAYIFNKIILNHEDKLIQIYSKPDNTGKLLTLTIPNLNLYQMLTVSPTEMEEHILEQAKFREELYADY